MKTKLNYIFFALVLLLNFSCTNDDDQEVTTSKTKTNTEAINVEEKVDLNNSDLTLQTARDGEPSNPKTKS